MHIEPGYYYHYKHNPEGQINNRAFQVLGIVAHTEIDPLEESLMVFYRPLYRDATVYQEKLMGDVRPLSLFLEPVINGRGEETPRFIKITDPHIIKELDYITRDMYGA